MSKGAEYGDFKKEEQNKTTEKIEFGEFREGRHAGGGVTQDDARDRVRWRETIFP